MRNFLMKFFALVFILVGIFLFVTDFSVFKIEVMGVLSGIVCIFIGIIIIFLCELDEMNDRTIELLQIILKTKKD